MKRKWQGIENSWIGFVGVYSALVSFGLLIIASAIAMVYPDQIRCEESIQFSLLLYLFFTAITLFALWFIFMCACVVEEITLWWIRRKQS